MKITVSEDGSYSFDISNQEDAKIAVSFMDEMKVERKDERKTCAEKKTAIAEGGSSLNEVQFETWEWLCENDSENGATPFAYAKAKGLSVGVASNRLSTLVKLGYATRLGRGHYRPELP
jgi:hypothetical protein